MSCLLRFTPLGGVAEIGSNMSWFRSQEANFVIDCGILFADDPWLGIDYLIPDFSELRQDPPEWIVFSHAHEDHIGAAAHFLAEFPKTKILCNSLTQRMLERKLSHLSHSLHFDIVRAGDAVEIGDLRLEFIPVDHSIPQTLGVLIQDRANRYQAFYASDFKIDSLDGRPPQNIQVLANKMNGKIPICLGLIDSTNILNSGKTPAESELKKALLASIQRAPGRVFVTLFASNMHRVKTVLQIAQQLHLQVHVEGLSLEKAIEIGTKENIFSSEELSTLSTGDRNPKTKRVILASGCQGDFRSSLKRIVKKEHSRWKIINSDLFVFSSKVIPGNEQSVYQLYNDITEQGGEILTEEDALIHASGHPGQKDLAILYNAVNFTHIVPIHGETLFLKRHKDWIEKQFSKIHPLNLLNHDQLEIGTEVKVVQREQKPPQLVQGKLGVLPKEVFGQRRKLAEAGVFSISFTAKKELSGIKSFGVPEDQVRAHWNFAKSFVAWGNELKRLTPEQFEEEVRVRTRRKLKDVLGFRPIVQVFCH